MKFRTLRGLDVRGKRVVVREDLNVPMKDGAVGDPTRILAARDTLGYLRDQGARTVVLSHLGRPDGKIVPALSLRPVAAALAAALGTPVAFADDCVGPVAEAAVAKLRDGDIVLLENVRFHAEEEANDPAFAKALAALGTFTSTTRSGRRTARMPRPKGSRAICRPSPAFSWKTNSMRSRRSSPIRSSRSSARSAAPRSKTRSGCSRT
jgi:hypothetical protein